MAKQTIFQDKDGNKLQCYINDKDLVFLEAGELENDEHHYRGYICLESQDVGALIEVLTELKKDLDGTIDLN